MKFSRRDVLRSSTTAALVGGAALAPIAETPAAAATRMPKAADRTAKAAIVAPPQGVRDRFIAVLDWMVAAGWSEYLLETAGLDLRRAQREGDAVLLEDLKMPPAVDFAEFGGLRAIQPGDPAMSLLYHALASPDVHPTTAGGERLPVSAYPTLAHIDALENFIYALAPFPSPDDADLQLAVFAYEYRHAGKTPHRHHADLVYARTGVARAGTHPAHWDPVTRSHVTRVEAPAPADAIAVTPARYGLFLARAAKKGSVYRFGHNSLDRGYDFLVPVRKLYDGCPLLAGHRLSFGQRHRDEKLARLADFVSVPKELNLEAAPFVRNAASEATADGSKALPGNDTLLADVRMHPGSALLMPAPRPLIEDAMQGTKRARFVVPAEKERHWGLTSNRRYSTLKLLKKPFREVIDFALSDGVFGGGRHTTGLRSPRNGPVFVNIRHEVTASGEVKHIGETREDLAKVAAGGYEAALFTDGLCDGCVEAILTPGPGAGAQLPNWFTKPRLPAFSLVAAPDFFPKFDPIDLRAHDKHFLEGGTETASGGRLPANPHIRLASNMAERAFPPSLSDEALTVTAAVSAPPDHRASERPLSYRKADGVTTLPDGVSNVFAPGWDVTYADHQQPDQSRSVIYYTTFGLGSPFPEDMKLCAAANGMWAGSSPDASRTFYPDLETIPVVGRPATAMPLTDRELGFHPQSPAVLEKRSEALRGWDGEYGPFIVPHALSISVDYADMMLSDYVVNARSGWMDLGRMRELTALDIIDRMDALRACVARLPGRDHPRNTKLWLVSAERVDDWGTGAAALGWPAALGGRDGRGRIAGTGLSGAGWLYVFAALKGAPTCSSEPGRRRQRCSGLFACRVAGETVSYTHVTAPGGPSAQLSWG